MFFGGEGLCMTCGGMALVILGEFGSGCDGVDWDSGSRYFT